MNKDFEIFLAQIEHNLQELKPSQRLEVLNEITQKYQNENTANINPESIAKDYKNKYIPSNPITRPDTNLNNKQHSFISFLIKFFIFGFISMVLLIGFAVYKFTPVFKIDEKSKRIIILGGLIDIDGEEGKFRIGNSIHFADSSNYKHEFNANLDLGQKSETLNLLFSTGYYKIETNSDDSISIACKLNTPPIDDIILQDLKNISVDLSKYKGSCNIKIPKDFSLNLKAKAATIDIKEALFNSDIKLDEGTVVFIPHKSSSYNYDLTVKNGTKDQFNSTQQSLNYDVKINIKNGSILNN